VSLTGANATGGAEQGTVTEGKALSFARLRPGRYVVSAQMDGYEPAKTEVEVKAGAEAKASLEMRPLPSTQPLLAGWADGRDWVLPGGWGAGSHSLAAAGEGVALPASAAFRNYGDFTLSSDVRMTSGHGVSFAVRAADAQNYFLIQVTGPQSGEPGQLRGFTVVNNTRTPFGAPVALSKAALDALSQDKFFTVALRVAGEYATAVVVNSQTGEATLLGRLALPAAPKSGAVGVVAAGAERVEVGRFAVYPADNSTGAEWVRGTVRNPRLGVPLAGALVQITDQASGAVVARVTNQAGGFSQDWLPPGDYRVRVSAQGFQPHEFVTTIAGEPRTLDPIDLNPTSPESRAAAVETAAAPKAPPSAPEATPEAPGTASADPTPRTAGMTVRDAPPDNISHVTLGTMASAKGTIAITAPAGARVLVEPALGKEARLFTMPAKYMTVYLNQMRTGGYRIAATMNGRLIMDQNVFVQPGRVLQVNMRR
jgi:hypothetical protein